MRMRLQDVEAALEEDQITVRGDPVPDDDYEPVDLSWLDDEQCIDEPETVDDYDDGPDYHDYGYNPYELAHDSHAPDLGCRSVMNQYGFTDEVDESGSPECSQCHSAKMPNRGEGTACDACQAQFMLDCEHDFD